jgi:hypothetical protein
VPTVFVVQEPYARFNRVSGKVETQDLSDALRFGGLRYLILGKDVRAFTMPGQPMVAHMRHALRDFGGDDHLLCVGDPVAIGIAVAVAAQANRGEVKILKWDRHMNSTTGRPTGKGTYISCQIKL